MAMADLWNRLQEMHSGGLDTRILLIIMTMNYSVEVDQVSFAAFIQICNGNHWSDENSNVTALLLMFSAMGAERW